MLRRIRQLFQDSPKKRVQKPFRRAFRPPLTICDVMFFCELLQDLTNSLTKGVHDESTKRTEKPAVAYPALLLCFGCPLSSRDGCTAPRQKGTKRGQTRTERQKGTIQDRMRQVPPNSTPCEVLAYAVRAAQQRTTRPALGLVHNSTDPEAAKGNPAQFPAAVSDRLVQQGRQVTLKWDVGMVGKQAKESGAACRCRTRRSP